MNTPLATKRERLKLHKVGDWWARTPLTYFDPLISFANETLNEENWREALWKAMGDERFSWVTYAANGKTVEDLIPQTDIMTHVSIEIGLGWFFPAEKEQEVIRKIEEAIKAVKPDLPKIFRQEPTFELTKELQRKVSEILDLIATTASPVEHQQNGKVVPLLGKAAHEKRYWIQMTGQEFNYWNLPPYIRNLEQYEKISEMIRREFDALEKRTAVVNSTTGFICFDDIGEDAARTLSWVLGGFVNVVFKNEMVTLKKCLWCRKYFIHTTRHKKQYCSDNCRYDDHNKGSKCIVD
jgi:hypothetical protein